MARATTAALVILAAAIFAATLSPSAALPQGNRKLLNFDPTPVVPAPKNATANGNNNGGDGVSGGNYISNVQKNGNKSQKSTPKPSEAANTTSNRRYPATTTQKPTTPKPANQSNKAFNVIGTGDAYGGNSNNNTVTASGDNAKANRNNNGGDGVSGENGIENYQKNDNSSGGRQSNKAVNFISTGDAYGGDSNNNSVTAGDKPPPKPPVDPAGGGIAL